MNDFSSLNRSDLSSTGKSENNQGENEHFIDQRKNRRPCFPTQNDRIAFINQSSIEQRCVINASFLFSFSLIEKKFYSIKFIFSVRYKTMSMMC